MNDYLPKDVLAALHSAPLGTRSRRNRLVVEVDGTRHAVVSIWADGFAVSSDTPRLRGTVDLFDAARHLRRCLIVAAAAEDGIVRYEFKRAGTGCTSQPLDYVRNVDAPVGYIGLDAGL